MENPVVEEEDDEDGKKKKRNLSQEYLRYLVAHRISNNNAQLLRPIEEWCEYASHPRLRSMQDTYFDIVRHKLRLQSFSDVFKPLHADDMLQIELDRGERIEKLLKQHHQLSDAQFKMFIVGLIKVIQRKSGKRNTFYIMGRSNTGKSMLLETFVRSYFNNAFGCPSGNYNSGFPFNDCVNQRVLLIEEPAVTERNHEDYKKIMGGQAMRCDKKYAGSGEVPPTPVLMTANVPVWKYVPSQEETFRNRCFIFYFGTPVDETSDFIPIEKDDWDYVLTKYYHQFHLGNIMATYKYQ